MRWSYYITQCDSRLQCLVLATQAFWLCLLPTATRHIRYTNDGGDDIDHESHMTMVMAVMLMLLLNSQKLGIDWNLGNKIFRIFSIFLQL